MTTNPGGPQAQARDETGATGTGADRLLVIDCLRGIAAVAVFLFHVSVVAGFPKRTLPPFTLGGRIYDNLISPLGLGASGVNLFFVISGFCLALQQWRAGRTHLLVGPKHPELLRYAQNRVARIGPAYWLTVLISAALVRALHPIPLSVLCTDVLLHCAFLHGLNPQTFLSLHGGLWSMATEVQFYVMFPLLLWLYAVAGGTRFVLLSAIFTCVFRVIVARYPFPETHAVSSWSALLAYQLPGRLLEFALGMWLAELYLSRLQTSSQASSQSKSATASQVVFRYLWIPTLLVALYCRALGPPYSPDIALGLFYFALCARVLLLPSRQADTSLAPTTAAPPRGASRALVWAARFGRASYSFFLIHYPILVVLSLLCPAREDAIYARFFFLLLTAFPPSLGAAVLLYLRVELPLWRRFRARSVER